MRRLPIFFVIDVSESMVGEPIMEVAAGLREMIAALRQNPYALETAFISVIVFAGKAKTIVPLTDVVSFYPPQFPIGGGTSLSTAMQHLIRELESKLIRNDGTQKGDWKPIVFLFTDGSPTDDSEAAIREWNQKYREKINLVAISVGNNTDLNLLRRLTDNVLLFNNTTADSYAKFFKWITASISAQSQKIETHKSDAFQLETLDDTVARKVDLSKTIPPQLDDNFVVLPAKCQRTEALYLIKFRRNLDFDEWPEFIEEGYSAPTARAFSLVGAFRLELPNEYQELSANMQGKSSVNTKELEGNPSCPCCANRFGFSVCACGGVHCVHGEGTNRCPWCKAEGFYGLSSSEDPGSNVTRGLG